MLQRRHIYANIQLAFTLFHHVETYCAVYMYMTWAQEGDGKREKGKSQTPIHVLSIASRPTDPDNAVTLDVLYAWTY